MLAFVVDQFILPLQKEITCKIRHFFCSAKPRRGGGGQWVARTCTEWNRSTQYISQTNIYFAAWSIHCLLTIMYVWDGLVNVLTRNPFIPQRKSSQLVDVHILCGHEQSKFVQSGDNKHKTWEPDFKKPSDQSSLSVFIIEITDTRLESQNLKNTPNTKIRYCDLDSVSHFKCNIK